MSFVQFSNVARKAAKIHVCIWCGQNIVIGATYMDERSVYDGNIQRHRWHPECQQVMHSHDDEEFTAHDNDRPEPHDVGRWHPESDGDSHARTYYVVHTRKHDRVDCSSWQEARTTARKLNAEQRFADYDQRSCLDYIRRHDANGFATLEGDETIEQLREACVLISTP